METDVPTAESARTRRIRAALPPVATAAAGLAALVAGRHDHHRVLGEAYFLELFVTQLAFPLILYAAYASPEHGVTRRFSLGVRGAATVLFALFVAYPVYTIFGEPGFGAFCGLFVVTYSGWFLSRGWRADRLDLPRAVLPMLAWWGALVLLFAVGTILRAAGVEAGTYVVGHDGDGYYQWPAGWLGCAAGYFAALAVFEWTGVYDRAGVRIAALAKKHRSAG